MSHMEMGVMGWGGEGWRSEWSKRGRQIQKFGFVKIPYFRHIFVRNRLSLNDED